MKQINRFLALLLVLVMLMSVLPVGVFAVEKASTDALVLGVSTASGKAGETVTVDISLDKNPGITTLEIELTYDPNVLTLASEPECTDLLGKDVTFSENLTNIPYYIACVNALLKENITATGKLATLTFTINKDAAEGAESAIELIRVDGLNCDLDDYTGQANNGKVTVSGHSWGKASYEWADDYTSCTATVSCTCCSDNTVTETVSASSVYTAADCDSAEKTVYTADFTKKPFEDQTHTVIGQPALGHSWGAASYTWAEDHSTCTASHSCTACGEPETENVTAMVEIDASSCYEAGKKTYIATFTKEGFTTQTYEETLDIVGHNWGETSYEWAANHSTCTAARSCDADGCTASETETTTAEVVTTEATCEEDGSTVYTAEFVNDDFQTQTYTETLDAPGHDWSDVTYTWAAGYGACTAERACQRADCGAKETETKQSECVTVDPTEDADGSNTYTVNFDNHAFEDQTYVEILYAEAMITVSSAAVHASQSVDVTVSMKNNPGIVALELDMTYDGAILELTNVEDLGLLGGFVSSSEEGNTNYHKIPFYLSWQQNDSCSISGDLVTLTFLVKDTCKEGDTSAISAAIKSAIDTDLNSVEFAAKNGAVTVLDHAWSEATYTWSEGNSTCTAVRTCSCGAEETETAQAAAEVTEPTCTEAGYTVYTAEFTNPAFAQQQKTVEGQPATGHNWGEASYTWAEDNDACTAEHTCTVTDCGVEETETVNTTAETTDPTCTEAGKTVYAADFTKVGFEDQTKEVSIDALGHDYQVTGSVDGDISCHCGNCGEPYPDDRYNADVDNTTPIIAISDAEGYVGETVEVTIELQNNPGLVGAILNLSYDSTVLELVEVEDGQLLQDPVFGNDLETVPYLLTWMDAESADATESGLLVTLTFEIRSGVADGTTAVVEVTYDPDNIINTELENVPFAIDNGVVTANRKDVEEPEDPDEDKQHVTFRLIGDSDHADGVDGHEEYVTWIATTTYEFEEGDTVYDVFVQAISDHGLSQKGASGGYVSAIRAPSVLGGYWLSEYDNGPNSGWMYTVNGRHVSDALTECELEDGDRIIWHYSDDYTQEENPSSPHYQRWLEAEDISPEAYVKEREEEEDEEADTEFDDVHENDWFYDEVQYAVSNGLFNGVGNDKFDPNGSMSRAMLVTVLYRLEGEPAVRGTSPFSDVSNNIWYTDAVIWAEDNAIVNGVGDNKFDPNSSITREQMAAVLFRYAQYKKYDTSASNSLTKYSDFTSISVYALNALKWANAEGLITGRTATTLVPKDTATRAEVAAILYRFVENVVNK